MGSQINTASNTATLFAFYMAAGVGVRLALHCVDADRGREPGSGLLGVGGHLLVRLRPATTSNISYDPSTVASFAPIPFGLGCLLIVWFCLEESPLGVNR